MARPERRLRLVGIYVGAALLLFWALAPIYWVLVSSISTRIELYARPNKVWFPSQPDVRALPGAAVQRRRGATAVGQTRGGRGPALAAA